MLGCSIIYIMYISVSCQNTHQVAVSTKVLQAHTNTYSHIPMFSPVSKLHAMMWGVWKQVTYNVRLCKSCTMQCWWMLQRFLDILIFY